MLELQWCYQKGDYGEKSICFGFRSVVQSLAESVVQTHCPGHALVSQQSEATFGQVFDSCYSCVWAGKENGKTSFARAGSPGTCCSFLQKDAFCLCAGGLFSASVFIAPLVGLSFSV